MSVWVKTTTFFFKHLAGLPLTILYILLFCQDLRMYYISIYSYNTFFMETYLECHDEIFSEAACQLIWHLSREQTVAATKTAAFVPPTHLFNLPPCFESDFFTIYQKIRSIDMACDTHCMTRPKFSSRPFPRLSLDNFF